jgi:hypothetical protein
MPCTVAWSGPRRHLEGGAFAGVDLRELRLRDRCDEDDGVGGGDAEDRLLIVDQLPLAGPMRNDDARLRDAERRCDGSRSCDLERALGVLLLSRVLRRAEHRLSAGDRRLAVLREDGSDHLSRLHMITVDDEEALDGPAKRGADLLLLDGVGVAGSAHEDLERLPRGDRGSNRRRGVVGPCVVRGRRRSVAASQRDGECNGKHPCERACHLVPQRSSCACAMR